MSLLTLLNAPAGGGGAASVLQSVKQSGLAPITLTGVTAGSALVLSIASDAPVRTTSVTDSSGATWGTPKVHYAGPVCRIIVYVLENASAGTHTLTASIDINSGASLILAEVGGVTTTPYDAAVAGTAQGIPSTNVVSGTPSQADELILTFMTPETGGTITDSCTSGFTLVQHELDNGAYYGHSVFSKVISSAAAQTATWGMSNADNMVLAIIGLKAASGGGGGTSLTPGASSIAFSGYAPTIAQPQDLSPGVGPVALTGYSPTLALTANQALAPAVASLVLTGQVPTLAQTANQSTLPGAYALTLTGYAPAITQGSGLNLTPGVGAVLLSGYAPTVASTANQALSPAQAAVTLTGYAPLIGQPQGLSPGVDAVALSGFAPTVGQTANAGVSPDAYSLTLSGYAPALTQTANQAVVPGPDALVFSGYVPVVSVASASVSLFPDTDAIQITGFAPDVYQTGAAAANLNEKKKRRRKAEIAALQADMQSEAEAVQVANQVVQVLSQPHNDEDEEDALMLLL